MARTGRRTKANKKTPKAEIGPREPIELDHRQIRAALILAQLGYRPGQATKSGALKACYETLNIARTTLYEWLQIPEFLQELTRQSQDCHDQLMAAAAHAMREGNAKLIERFLDVRFPEVFERKRSLMELRHKQQMELMKLAAELKINPELETPTAPLSISWKVRPGVKR